MQKLLGMIIIVTLIGYTGISVNTVSHSAYAASSSIVLLSSAKKLSLAADPTLLKKANETLAYISNGYTGEKKVVKGIDAINKQLLVSLIESIYYSKENKVFFPFFPKEYHLGVVIPPRALQLTDVFSLANQPSFKLKADATEVIVFNGFTFTSKKVVGLDLAYRTVVEEAINAIKSSPDNVIGPDPAG